jgi:hypothetical protein
MTTTLRPTAKLAKILGLADLGDVVDRVHHAGQFFALGLQRLDAGKAHAEEDRVIVATQRRQGDVAAQRLVVADLDAADLEQEVDFRAGEMIRHLVFGDAVFVEAAGMGASLIDHDIMAQHRQAMGAGQARRAGTDHRDLAAGEGRPGERMLSRCHQMVGGITLQPADGHRLVFLGGAHAGLFAQDLGRADAGAGAAEDIGFQDADGRAADVVGRDLLDETGDVDAGGAGLDAGRIVAEVAAVGLDQRGLAVQHRDQVVEIVGVLVGLQAAGSDVGAEPDLGHVAHGRHPRNAGSAPATGASIGTDGWGRAWSSMLKPPWLYGLT